LVTTGSTKSRHKADWQATKSRKVKAAPEPAPQTDVADRLWLIGCLVILTLAAYLRIYHLDLVPLHHDEGVNGNFLVRLVREGAYQYDPQNYHGPSLYYFAAIAGWVLRFLAGEHAQNAYGLNTVTIRLVTALFGVGTVALILSLRRRLGTAGALGAATLLAISPGAVYLSRYFIHETLFVFFTLGIVVAGLKYFEDGHPVYLILAAASAALLFATKETFIINAPVLLIAVVSTQIYLALRKKSGPERRRSKYEESVLDRLRGHLERLGGGRWVAILALVAVAVFIFVSVLFFSSFFTNSKGVSDSLRTFEIWTKTGQQAHVHPIWKYVEWLALQESPVLILGAIGAVVALWRARNSFAVFSALWAFGTLAAYSLVPYKTPWIGLNFIVPLAIISGNALQEIYETPWGRYAAPAILAVALVVSGYQTFDLNFRNYDNDDGYYVYVYAHTRRDFLQMVDEINRVARVSGEGGRMGVTVVSPDYWPLPWYLRDYTRVGYFGHMTTSTEPVVIASETQREEVQATMGNRYTLINSNLNANGGYSLRPGVDLLVFVRRDLASK
jgi:uncharacterized protein (TIGR03663 family)